MFQIKKYYQLFHSPSLYRIKKNKYFHHNFYFVQLKCRKIFSMLFIPLYQSHYSIETKQNESLGPNRGNIRAYIHMSIIENTLLMNTKNRGILFKNTKNNRVKRFDGLNCFQPWKKILLWKYWVYYFSIKKSLQIKTEIPIIFCSNRCWPSWQNTEIVAFNKCLFDN